MGGPLSRSFTHFLDTPRGLDAGWASPYRRIEAISTIAAMLSQNSWVRCMLAPESDWTPRIPKGAAHFRIDHRLQAAGVSADIRRFRWVSTESGPLLPKDHFIDCSLAPHVRRSSLKCGDWRGERAPGEMLYLPPGQVYIGQPAPEPRHLLCIALSQQFLDEVFQEEGGAPSMRPCTDIHNPVLRRLLYRVASELAAPCFGRDAMVQATLIAAAVELVRHISGSCHKDERLGRPSARQIRIAIDYIMDNLDTDLRIVAIARECGVSARHLTRLFKLETGTSIGEYVAMSRIAMAKDMLCIDRQSIKEISWRCGFQSASAFSAAFRMATGTTPRAYREVRIGA